MTQLLTNNDSAKIIELATNNALILFFTDNDEKLLGGL